MYAPNSKTITALNHLIRTCKDGQRGFYNAELGVRNTELRKSFHTYQHHRRMLMAELLPEVLSLGGAPYARGTLSATLRRGWLNLRQLLAGGSDALTLDAAERDDALAVRRYEAALHVDLPPAIRAIVERQYDEIKMVHDRISELKRGL